MASSNFDYSDYQKLAPPYDEPPRQRGCFFYGCIISAVLSVLLLVAIGVISFALYRWAQSMVEQYTATAPRDLPNLEMPAERRVAVKERVDAFRAAVKEGRPTGPLILDSDELNALIEDNPDLKGKVFATIDGDKLKGKVSIPLSQFPSFGLTQGRFLNGEAELKASLRDGVLIVTLESIEVNGKTLPPEVMNGLRNQNLAKDMYKDQKSADEMRKYESIEIKDGKLIIKARDPSRSSESGAAGSKDASPAEGKANVHHPDAKPAATKGAEDLPDDVLAPPDARKPAPVEPAEKP